MAKQNALGRPAKGRKSSSVALTESAWNLADLLAKSSGVSRNDWIEALILAQAPDNQTEKEVNGVVNSESEDGKIEEAIDSLASALAAIAKSVDPVEIALVRDRLRVLVEVLRR